MSLSGWEFYTKNKEMQRYMDILSKDAYVELPSRFSQEFGRHQSVQRFRDPTKSNPLITISKDYKFNQSAIKIKKPLVMKKDGNKYKFELIL